MSLAMLEKDLYGIVALASFYPRLAGVALKIRRCITMSVDGSGSMQGAAIPRPGLM